MRWLVLVMRLLIVTAFVALLTMLIGLFNPAFVQWDALFQFFLYLRDTISYGMFFVFSILPFLLGYLFAAIFQYIPYFNVHFFMGTFSVLTQGIIGPWFSFYGISPQLRFQYAGGNPALNATDFNQLVSALTESAQLMTGEFYYLIFQFFLLFSIASGIRLVIQSDAKYALRSMFFVILMIVVPLAISGLIDLLGLFNLAPEFLTTLPNALNEVVTRAPGDSIREFVLWSYDSSTNFWIPIAMYGFVELSFQLEYIDHVTKPSVERASRLTAQLNTIRRQARAGTAYIEEIKEETRRKREQLGEVEEKASQFLGQSLGGFSGVKEMIEKHRLEKEEREWLQAAHDTRRLGSYVEKLFVEDPEAEKTLTAATSAPEPFRLAASTFISLILRGVVVAFIVVYISHPEVLFRLLFNSPVSIRESLEITTPEVIIVVLVPFILLFPAVAAGVRAVKRQRLKQRLAEEGTLEALMATLKKEERERWGFFKGDSKKKRKEKEKEKEVFLSVNAKKRRKKDYNAKK